MPAFFSRLSPLRRPLARTLVAALAACGALPALANDYDDVDRLTQARRFDEAMGRAEKFLKDKPRDPQMRFLKGVIQLDSGKRSEAIATFTQLTQDTPELPEPYNNLAVIYASQSQFDKARVALEGAVRANPGYAAAHENLGDVYARLASQAYGQAQRLDPSNAALPSKQAVIRTLFSPTAAGQKTGLAAAPAPALAPQRTPARAAAPAPEAPAPAAPASLLASTPAPAPAAAPAPAPASGTASKPPTRAQAAAILAAAKAPAASAAAPAAPTSNASADVEKAVRAWATTWSAQDMTGHLAAYAADFTPAAGQTRQDWEEERRARITGRSNVSLGIDNLSVVVEGNTAMVKFKQSYRADNLNVSSRRTLEMVRGSTGQWQIRKELAGG